MLKLEPIVSRMIRNPVWRKHLRVADLCVVDTSVTPRIIGGNINSPTLMIAEKVSHWIAAGL